MNTPHLLHTRRPLCAFALTALLLGSSLGAGAAPGAHGPNGEHLDAPAPLRAASALPRVQAQSESFELVAELQAGELVIWVDRYTTNEPVLGAKLEVESGALKAMASFRAAQGDYAVSDAALLKALAVPGEHTLVFTLVAGSDSDLLDGTLVSAAGNAAGPGDHGHAHGADDHGHGHDHALERTAWAGAGLAGLLLLGGVAWRRKNRRAAGKLQGGL